jgi:hypothetical protein
MLVRDSQSLKAFSPIYTMLDMSMLVNAHPTKVPSFITVTPSGILISVNLQPENASPPMLVTPSGMCMDVNELHPEKAPPPLFLLHHRGY